MNDFERKLRQLGETADRQVPSGLAPRPGALRRIRMRRRVVSGGLVLSVALVVTGGVALSTRSTREAAPLPPAERREGHTEAPVVPFRTCDVPFEPTYLPSGIGPQPKPGSGGRPDADPVIALEHFRGPRGTFIDVILHRTGSFSLTRRERITVLGLPATLGDIHEGYSVEFEIGNCHYQLLAYGIDRRELRLFAEGLLSVTPRDPRFGSVWPENTLGEARLGCVEGWRADLGAVATEFAAEMLRWPEPESIGSSATIGESTIDLVPSPATAREPGVESGVRLTLGEILPGCWSVVSVSPLDGRRRSSLGISVEGRIAELVFDKHGATSATVEVGYGSTTSSMTWHKGEGDVATVHVGGPGRRDTGHFLILFRDANGDPFTALGRPLPPGDFAAG